MNAPNTYDVAIAGGGLGGLTMAIHLARLGHSVVLFEKDRYPFHRVCGEYISLESSSFLKETGIDIETLGLPVIRTLELSSPNGNLLRQSLPLGGFGISRYTLDHKLSVLAEETGVVLKQNDKVSDIRYHDGEMILDARSGNYRSRVAVGSFGKRSNLDLKWDRPFARNKPSKLNNYIGIKYHIRYDHPKDVIALHNFEDGYCGMSAIEDGISCLCYLTTAANLERSGNNIKEMEREILCRNPHLAAIFRDAEFVFSEPVAISQVSFEKKECIHDHILLAGDAAGMITPLCGNGMTMAMHGGKIATGLVHEFLQHRISRDRMETQYRREWEKQFSGRLRAGRWIQSMFGKPSVTDLFIGAMKPFPRAVEWLIRQTHGKSY